MTASHAIKLFSLFFIPLVLAVGLTLFRPQAALAQGPECDAEPVTVVVEFTDTNPVSVYDQTPGIVTSLGLSSEYNVSPPTSLRIDKTIGSGSSPYVKYRLPVSPCPITQTVTLDGNFLIVGGDSSGFWVSARYQDGTQVDDFSGTCPPRFYLGYGSSFVGSCSFSVTSTPDNPVTDFIITWLWYAGTSGIESFNQVAYIDDLVVDFQYGGEVDEPPAPLELCPLVENAHFAAETGWLLSGGSVITDGILTLPVSGLAAQNLTLQSTTAYSAVISTTQSFSGSTSVDVTLGTQSQTVEITGAGRFTASFTTPSLGGPIAYGLENTGPDTVDLDFTCVFAGSAGSGSQGDCIAPINGTFDTAENWTFLRGAEWNSPSGKAFLPYADVSLLTSSSTYSLPTITGTQNLLLGFDARKTNNNETGAIMGRVYAGSSVNWTFETYGTDYRFETSLNTLAGSSNAEIAFVNPGLTGSDLISSTSDIVLDNVCVFLADRGPNLPAPTDPNGIPPVDLGFNYTSCDDADGILASFGVNIQQYRTEYQAGPSLWDPIGWVPWLIAAGWNILATWLCVFLAAFVSLVDLLQYFVNLFLNILNWMVRSFPAWRDWLAAWLAWLGTSLANLSNAYAAFLASWSDWIGDSLANLSDWIGGSLANLSDGLAQFLANWSDWIAESLANLSDWIGAELAAWSDWIGASLANFAAWLSGDPWNALRSILNILIEAWNIYLAAFSEIISLAFDLLVYLWNLLVPFLSAVWGYIAGGSTVFANPLLALILAVISLVFMVVSWVWANVFLVVSIPINFYYAFDDGIKSEAFAYLMTCAETNFWCQMLAGIQLVNQTSAHTLMYPIVIVGIIIGSIVVFWEELWALFTTPVS